MDERHSQEDGQEDTKVDVTTRIGLDGCLELIALLKPYTELLVASDSSTMLVANLIGAMALKDPNEVYRVAQLLGKQGSTPLDAVTQIAIGFREQDITRIIQVGMALGEL